MSAECRSCGEQIVWLKTHKGKSMPVDAYSVESGDALFERNRHISHFDTCPDADKFRAGKKPITGND